MSEPRTLIDKIWERHVIVAQDGGPSLLYVDRHLVHDGSLHAFEMLRDRKLTVARPSKVFGVPDHYVPTRSRNAADAPTLAIARMIDVFNENMESNGIQMFPLEDHRQGIVHVVGPEQGFTLPGTLLVCNDSHTSTHGALGAFSFGIGQSENAHVLAARILWQPRPRAMRITVNGSLNGGVSAKDLILSIIGKIGAGGAVGYVVEYAGSVIRALSVEERMTVCNMSIESGARAGIIAPDDTTFEYLHGRPFAPKDDKWNRAVAYWCTLPSDDSAHFDREITLDACELAPMVTWGPNPEDVLPITARAPKPSEEPDEKRRDHIKTALKYMGIEPGTALDGIPIDVVFIGSCTNGWIEDMRAAAQILKGTKVVIPTNIVPGSGLVKRAAEAEGLDRVVRSAGAEWREPGCSMCVGMNGDLLANGQRSAWTSTRNFPGRQGVGARTHLVSPVMAAAAATHGRLVDVRRMAGH